MAEDAKKGLEGGRTPAENSGGDGRPPDLAGAVAKLAGLLDPDDDGQLDLLSGSPDLDAGDMLSRAAETENDRRRGVGRPKGSANKRNTQVFDYLEALGHRDPLVTLSLIQSADTEQLATLLACDKIDALRIQAQAAKDMLPFKYAKKPLEVEVNKRSLHMFISGDMGGTALTGKDGTMSALGDGSMIDGEAVTPQTRDLDDKLDQ